jgi:lipoprotein-anchoring transpeptidase ErfK/SrfK
VAQRRSSWAEPTIALAVALTATAAAGCGGGAPKPAPAAPAVLPAPRPAAAAPVAEHRPRPTYAFVDRPVTVRRGPGRHAPALGRLTTRTQDGTDELVAIVRGRGAWLHVRTPLRTPGQTGWIPRAATSAPVALRTRLVVDRRRLTLTLTRPGHRPLRLPIGVGKPSTPTPSGRFYVRDHLTGLPRGGIYGPQAFGTSARSTHITDWPGGSFIGIHGTNEPGLIPGRISHGCVRLRNRDIDRLARVLPVGTPVVIR